jgi:UDP-N-acetyl-D-glucosamine dehydrogenase
MEIVMNEAVGVQSSLDERLRRKEARIGVVGLGYVGLPLAVEYARQGFDTIGLDTDPSKVEALGRGYSYIQDVEGEEVKEVVDAGTFRATDQAGALAEADVIFICVPTPITPNKDPDVRYMRSAAEAIAGHLRRGHLVILKSTTYPGTTEDLVGPILAARAKEEGLELGRDYFLAFSPERIDPGNRQFSTANTPVVVGGVTDACTALASRAMGAVVAQVHEVSSPRVAEMEKLLENIFRSVNIALVNELSQLCDRIGGMSIWEVVQAAATKPFGFMPFYPGPGLGGHCIPIDPYYLSWLARRYDFETNFITLSARTNEEMPYYVVESVIKAIAEQPVRLPEARILVLGAAFKKNVDDVRHSPAIRIIQLLRENGISEITLADPFVPELRVATLGENHVYRSEPVTEDLVSNHDVVVLVTDHDNYPYEMIASRATCVIDTRNGFARINGGRKNIRVLGGGHF